MYKEKQIIRINDILSEFHRQKCIIVKKNKKSYDVETLCKRKTRIRLVEEQMIGVV